MAINPGGVMQRVAPKPPPKPKTIIAQAIASHPAWATPAPKPKPKPTAPMVTLPKVVTPSPNKPAPTYSGTTVTTPPPAPDPLDSTYYQNVTAHTAGVNNQIAGWQKQQTDAANALPTFDYTQSYTPATGGFAGPAAALAQQHATDVLAQQIAAARRGGLYSTGLAQALGNVDQGYQDKFNTANTNYGALASRIAEQIAGAQTGDIEYQGTQREDAVDRAAQAAANNPALGMPTTPLANDQYLIRGGAASPNFTLTPPKGAPKGAKWSGGAKPPGNWRGIGGGWWVPAGGK